MARKDPLNLAIARVGAATVAFTEAADNLLTEAAVLECIAAEADDAADAALLRAAAAQAQAHTAQQRAAKLRDLVG